MNRTHAIVAITATALTAFVLGAWWAEKPEPVAPAPEESLDAFYHRTMAAAPKPKLINPFRDQPPPQKLTNPFREQPDAIYLAPGTTLDQLNRRDPDSLRLREVEALEASARAQREQAIRGY